jgi:hypothetical protein
MYFLLIISIGFFLGYKIRGAVEVYRQVKQVKSVESIVEKVINNREIKIIEEFRKKEKEASL